MKTYPWFDQVPAGLKTRRQLAELGLRPGGPIVAQVVWRKGKAFANLYDETAALPKQQMTEGRRAALEKANEKRRTCPKCHTVFSYVLGRRWRPWRDCDVCRRVDVRRSAQVWVRSPRTVILDTETTSLDGFLVQIAVIRAHDGAVLLDTLTNPRSPISEGAQQIHGLTEDQLAGAPTFAQIADDLAALLRGRRVVTYNADFDRGILRNELHRLAGEVSIADRALFADRWLRPDRWRCAMELYATWIGDWSERRRSFRWYPLPGGDHTALGDAQACREVLLRMAAEARLECP
jgi:DNA polymerase III epsilon subunit-like protein